MNQYIIPICEIQNSKVYNIKISARSENDCREKIIERFSDISESDDWDDFIDELDKQDILIGEITDIETL